MLHQWSLSPLRSPVSPAPSPLPSDACSRSGEHFPGARRIIDSQDGPHGHRLVTRDVVRDSMGDANHTFVPSSSL